MVFLLVALLGLWPGSLAAQTLTPLWAQSFGANNDYIQSAATDADGNVYVGGYMSSASVTISPDIVLNRISSSSDMVVAKFDANGNALWAKNFGGASATTTRAYGIAVDSAGDVYLTGYFQGSTITIGANTLSLHGSTIAVVAAKLGGTDGTPVWAASFGNTGASVVGNHVAIDQSGNPVIAGYFSGADVVFGGTTLNKSSVQELFVARLNAATGAAMTAVNFGGDAATSVNTAGLAVDPTGNIYTFGYFTGGSMVFGADTLALDGTRNLWLSKLGPTGTPVWARRYGGTNVSGPNVSTYGSLAVDASGNAYFASSFHSGSLVVGNNTLPSLGGSSNALQTIVVARIDAGGTASWARSYGTASANSRAVSIKLDAAGNPLVSGYFNGATLGFGTAVLTRSGVTDAFLARFDTAGNLVWVQNYGGNDASVTPITVATGGTSNVIVGGNFTGAAASFGTISITPGAGQTMFLAGVNQTFPLSVSVAGTGTVTSAPAGISCGATCTASFNASSQVTLTATAGSGYTFSSWSGDCTGTVAATSVTMAAARNCTAIFTATGGQPNPPAPPSPPPPPFVSPTNPPPAVINADTTGSGQGTVSFASSFSNPSTLSFTASQTSGAALPAWLSFDPSSVSFNYDVPLPPNLPIQPSADASAEASARAVRAGRSIVNTVYPLSILVQTVPVSLTATGNGQSYTATINMDFYAPRSPVAVTAVSYSAAGVGGNATSSRPAISWDGAQLVFETLATNIASVDTGGISALMRYDGFSGRRDLLSQTAIPGGGVANAADGNSNNPAVAAAGNAAAFSSMASSISATPGNRLRQVYRTSLAYPRVPLNEAATPAAIMVSTTASGVPADAAADRPAVSERGDFIAFESAATNLGANANRVTQIWRKNAATGAIVLVSAAPDGSAGNGDSRNASMTWDGRFVVFDSTATNLEPGVTGGRHIYLKDLDNGLVYRLSSLSGASNPKVDARLTSVVYVSAANGPSQVLRYDIASGATAVVSATPMGVPANGASDQPTISADGRFVAFRSVATDLMAGQADNGQSQIWIRDVMRGATALVSQTEGGAPGNAASSDPALSGDGASIAFTSQASDLVNGAPPPGQIHLAANPLVLPGRTAYWYSTDGGNLTWSIERWGDQALIAALAYNPGGGLAVWAAGNCRFAGLTCQGSLTQWGQGGATAAPLGQATLTFSPDGRSASATLGNGTPRTLGHYPVGGSRISGFAGLPQAGYWGVVGNAPGVSSLFIDVDTQVGTNGASVQAAHVTLFGYDAAGNAQWYAAEGTLAADRTFAGQLYLYGGGSSWVDAGGSYWPSAMPVGTLRLAFQGSDRAQVQLPDGRVATIGRWRF